MLRKNKQLLINSELNKLRKQDSKDNLKHLNQIKDENTQDIIAKH
jgi:hypothetical protein